MFNSLNLSPDDRVQLAMVRTHLTMIGRPRPDLLGVLRHTLSYHSGGQRMHRLAHFSSAKSPRVYSATIPPRPGSGAAS